MNEARQTYKVLIGLGSNINPHHYLPRSIEKLARDTRILKVSSVWQSPSLGYEGPDFLNAAVLIETSYSPSFLKRKILCRIEKELDRVRGDNKNLPRTIDLDILIFHGKVVDQDLWNCAHVALPASEILPHFSNFRSGKDLRETSRALKDQVTIRKRPDIDLHALFSTGSSISG